MDTMTSKFKCEQICQKGLIHAQFQDTFSSPSVNYINAPTGHVFNIAEG